PHHPLPRSYHLSHILHTPSHLFFFFNNTPTTEIYTLSLHDALPISKYASSLSKYYCLPVNSWPEAGIGLANYDKAASVISEFRRSEEHTSELQSQSNLVCRLLLEKKKKTKKKIET